MSFNSKQNTNTDKAYAIQKGLGNQLAKQMLDYDTSKNNSISKKKTDKKILEINTTPIETDIKIEENIFFYENFLNKINEKDDSKREKHHHHHTPHTPNLIKRNSKALINFPNNATNFNGTTAEGNKTKKAKPRSSLNIQKNISSLQLFNGIVSKTASKFSPAEIKPITVYQTKTGELTEESKFMQSKNSNNHIVDIKSFDNNNNNHQSLIHFNNIRANSHKDSKEYNSNNSNSVMHGASNVIKSKSPKRSENSVSNHFSNKDLLGKNKQDHPDFGNNAIRLSAINEISKDGNAIAMETKENKENKKNNNAPIMSLSDNSSQECNHNNNNNKEMMINGKGASDNNVIGICKVKLNNQGKKKKRSWFFCCLPVH